MRLVAFLGGLKTLLGLEPDETELVLDIVDHDSLTLTTLFLGILGGGVGTLESEVLVLLLQVLAAVSLPQDVAVLGGNEVEGIGDELVTGYNILDALLD